MSRPLRNRLSPQLEVFASLLWIWFLLWSVAAFFVLPLSIGSFHVEKWIGDPTKLPRAAAALMLLQYFDLIWVLLGSISLYFYSITQEGIVVARRWALIILGVVSAVVLLNGATGFPLGGYLHTNRLGMRIFEWLPLGVPFLWYIVLLGGRYTLLAFFPLLRGRPRWQLGAAMAGLTLLADLNLEKIAMFYRLYWRWHPTAQLPPWPPLGHFVTWTLLSFALAFWLREGVVQRRAVATRPLLEKPVIIFFLLEAVFLTVHLVA